MSHKKTYTVREFYTILQKGLRTFPFLRKNKRNEQMSNHFVERIMLAVTEVNGCNICSYGHTKIALEQGMSSDEIQMLLSGGTDHVPTEELKAIMFAQHYADTKGCPTKESWQEVVDAYGEEKALGILGATRVIMGGNCYMMALGGLRDRVKGNAEKDSSLFYELRMLLSIVPFLPVAMIHAMIASVMKTPVIAFEQ